MEHWIPLKEPLVRDEYSFYIFTQYSFKFNVNYNLDIKSSLLP